MSDVIVAALTHLIESHENLEVFRDAFPAEGISGGNETDPPEDARGNQTARNETRGSQWVSW